MQFDARAINWLGLVRLLTQYVAPGLVVTALLGEVLRAMLFGEARTSATTAYDYVLVGLFTVLTVAMIGICGWTSFLWDIDRLFFKLESRIDAELGEVEAPAPEQDSDGSLLGRVRAMFNNALHDVRAKSIALIEQAYWDDINAGGVLAFPQPDIAAAVEQIDASRRDLLTPLTGLVAGAVPLGSLPAAIVSRLIFRYVAPQVKVRLYRRLVVRFLSQLAALFALTALCFFISILAWSRVDGAIFAGASGTTGNVLMYQLDLMLRGAFFDIMEHTKSSITPLAINQSSTAFVFYTLIFRMFVAIYVFSSFFKVARFVFRHWKAMLSTAVR